MFQQAHRVTTHAYIHEFHKHVLSIYSLWPKQHSGAWGYISEEPIELCFWLAAYGRCDEGRRQQCLDHTPLSMSTWEGHLLLLTELFRDVSPAHGVAPWPCASPLSAPFPFPGLGGTLNAWVRAHACWGERRLGPCQMHRIFPFNIAGLAWGPANNGEPKHNQWPSLYLTDPIASPFSWLPFGSPKKQ